MTSVIAIGIRALVVLFFFGSIGSLLVILLSLIDFVWTYVARDEVVSPPPPVQEPGHQQTI